MKKYIDISKYSSLGLLEELGEKEKRRMRFIHRMNFKDIAEAVFDEGDRFEFYYEAEEAEETRPD